MGVDGYYDELNMTHHMWPVLINYYYGRPLGRVNPKTWSALQKRGLAQRTDAGWHITEQGKFMAAAKEGHVRIEESVKSGATL